MRDGTPTMRARELGAGLRRAMERAGLTGQELAHRLDLSPSLMPRILTGHRKIRETDVATILALCGVTGAARQRLSTSV